MKPIEPNSEQDLQMALGSFTQIKAKNLVGGELIFGEK